MKILVEKWHDFSFGSVWIDNFWPAVIGLMAALVHATDGGSEIALLVGPVVGWMMWQLSRLAQLRLGKRRRLGIATRR